MSKTTIGNCAHCGKPFEQGDTIWMMRSKFYHPKCIRTNRDTLELWRATDWRQKDIL
jgi:hypothetical protein